MATAAHYDTQFVPQGAHFYNLKPVVSNVFPKSIIAATTAYMSALCNTFTEQTFDAIQHTDTISKLMDGYTTSAEQTQTQVSAELQQIADETPSGIFGEIMSYLFGGIMVIDGALTGDIAEVMMGIGSIALQASGGQQKLADALGSGGDLLAPLIISAGEMAVGGGLSTAYQISQGAIEKSVLSVASHLAATLTQALMVNNFWGTVAGKVNNPIGATFLGIALSLATVGLTSAWSSKYAIDQGDNPDAGSWLLKLMKKRFPGGAEATYNKILLALQTFKHSMQAGMGVTQIIEGTELLKAAATTKEWADTQKQFMLYQGASQIADSALNIAQGGQSAITQNFSSIMQSFSKLGELYAPQNNR